MMIMSNTPSLGEIIESGHPHDAPSTTHEKLFIRAMRREAHRGDKDHAATDEDTCKPVTADELEKIRRAMRVSGHYELADLLESALAEHDDNNGAVTSKTSSHWSVRSREMLSDIRQHNTRETKPRPVRLQNNGGLGKILIMFAILGLILLTACAALRYF